MASVENFRESLGGYRIDFELKNVPIGFVNGLRRVALAELPTVILTNVQILDNNTQLTHEMIRHRVEMLPINVLPEETAVLRDTKVELQYLPPSSEAVQDDRIVTTDQFQIAGPRKEIILKDRDLDEPLYFMTLAPNESLHIRASLGIDPRGSHVSVSTFSNHIDPNRAKLDKDTWIAEGGDPAVFDNFNIQRSYARDESGRPYWFDMAIESVGVIKARDILKRSVAVIQNKIVEWVKTPILRHGEGWYSMETEGETFTLGQLVQELMYSGGLADFVSRDIGHPLLPKLYIRFSSKLQPEAVVERVLEDIEFDETIERDERIRFFTLEEQTVDAFEQMVPRGRTTRYKLEQIQKTVDRYADLYTTFVVPTAERYNIREPTYAKSFDWVYPIYSSSGFKTYNYTTSWSSLFRDPTLPNIYPRMLAALPRPFPDVPGTPYAFASTTEFLDDQGRNPRRALPAYEMTRTQLHEDKTFDVVRVPVSGTDDVVAFKGYYLAARTLDVPNPLDDHPFLKSNQSSTIETTAPLSEVVPSLDAILTHGVPATQHPYRDAVPYLNLYSVQLSDIPWSSWKSRFPPVEVISSTPALADIPYPKMDRQKPSEKLETLYRSPYSPGMANRYWLMNQVDGGDLVVQMLLSQSIDNGSVETMPSTGLNPAAYPETTLDDPACNLVGNTFGDFVVKGLVRRLNKSYTCVPLEFLQQERKQRGYTGRLAWKESTGSDLLKTHIQSLGTFFYPKETKTKAVPETRTPAGPDSLRRKEVVAIQADPRRFVADKLRDIQELLKETTLTNHIYSDPDGAFVMCEHTLAIMSNDLRDDRLKYYDTWTVIDGGFRVCRFCGQRINADVTLNQDEYDENGFKIVQSEAMGAVVATTDAIAGFTDDFAGLRGLFQEDSAIDSTVHMLLSILHVLPNPALLDSLLKMGRLRAGKPSDQRTDILKLRGTIGIALVVLLFHLSTPPLVPRRSFGSTPFKLTGYPRDSDTPESFTTTDSVLLAIRKTFEAFPTTLKGPSLVIIRETLAHTKKVREDVHKVISVFMKSKSEDDAWLGKAMSDARTAIKTIHAVDAKDAVVPFIRAIAPPPAEAMNTLQHFTACPTRRAIYASGRVPPVRQAEVRLDARIVSSPFRVDVSPSPSVRVEPTRVTKDVIRQQLASRVDSALATTFVKVNVHTNTLIASRIADAFRVPAKVRSIDPTQNAAEQRDLAQGLLRTVLASVQGDEANRAQLLKMATQDVALYMTLADYKKERANVNKLRATERLTFVDRMSKKNDQDRETVRELLKIGLAPYIISTQDRGLFAREAESIQDQIARDRRRLEEFLDDEGVVADVGAPRDTDDQDDPPPAGADNGDYGDTMPRTEGRDQIQPQIYDDAEEGV